MKNLILILFAVIGGCFITNASGRDISFMTYNIRNCIGMDGKTDIGRVAAVINRISPDVVALQEIDSVTNRSHGISMIDTLARLTGMHGYFSAAIDYDGGKYGVGLLCRCKPDTVRCFSLPGREEQRTMILAEFPGYVFSCTHLSLTEDDRIASVNVIEDIASDYIYPFFVAGDFNSHPYEDACALLSQNYIFLNDMDAHTFPASDPVETIDYIIQNKRSDYAVSVMDSVVLDEPFASDHRPVVVKVRIYKD